jgi:hypothetical protein
MPVTKLFALVLLALFNAFSEFAFAQTSNPGQIELAERLDSLARNAAPEIAYIQTSKDIYETGEDLWFKVYLLNSQYLVPSLLSKTLYLQLLDENTRKVFWQEKYEIQNGSVNGRVYLESAMKEGDYLLAAYTSNSFVNSSSEFKAIMKIKIKTDISSSPPIIAKPDKLIYNERDTIRINVSAFLHDSTSADITATLVHENKRIQKVEATMDSIGYADITFNPCGISNDLQVIINVKNKYGNETLTVPVPQKPRLIQFMTFPEGGNLISGIQNKLAYKAVNKKGEPVNISGTLFADDIPVKEFKSTHAGMGCFIFTPESGKKYFVRMTEPAIDSVFVLPEIYPSGIALQLVKRDKESLYFNIIQSPGIDPGDIFLRVQCRGIVYALTSARLNNKLRIKVPLAGLPQGIAEVTLFKNSLPVAERLVYVNKDQKLNIKTEISKSIYPTRGKANLKISVTDENGLPVIANLGISIFDKLYENSSESNNILSHYYLNTELKGRIYDPSYYFSSTGKDREDALDLLLLTQGWRKYTWSEDNLRVYGNSRQQIVSDEVSGTIYYPHRKKKIPKKEVFAIVFSPNLDSTNVVIPADSAGEFVVSTGLLKKWESDYVYLKPLGPPGSQYSYQPNDPLALREFTLGIKITDPFEIINKKLGDYEFIYPITELQQEISNLPDSFITRKGLINIKPVTIRSKKQNIIRGKYMGTLDSIAGANDYVCPYGVLNCQRHPPDAPEIIVQGAGHYNPKPVPGKQYVVAYNYGTPGEYYRPITYRLHRYSEEDLLKLNNYSRVKAYYGSREFYQPNYDKDMIDTNIPDYRNTLLWAPSVFTNVMGEATLSFFCSDINTDFVGRIEGVGGDGLLGTGFFKFTVRKLKLDP